MPRHRLFLAFASSLIACESIIGLEAVRYGDGEGPNGSDATLEGSVEASVDGKVTPPADGGDSSIPLQRDADADAEAGPVIIAPRPDSSAGSQGVSCSGNTCSGSSHCCISTDAVRCSTSCDVDEARFRCDDPRDCAASNRGCCATSASGFLSGSSCETSCPSGFWFCVTTADCPQGLTCKAAPLFAPSDTKVCQ